MRRVRDPDDPRRCQFTFPHEQCWNEAVEGSDNCAAHGGALAQADENSRRLYHLTEARYRHRLAQLDEHDHLRTLREQIAFATRLINRRFNLVTDDPADLNATCGYAWDALILTKERLIKSAHLIEQNLGVLQSKSSVLRLGQLLIQIIVEELHGIADYDNIVTGIAEQTMQAITSANNGSAIQKIALPTLVKIGDKPVFQFADAEEQIRIAELSKHESIKSLNEDISLQIIMIERRFGAVKSDLDFMRACPQFCTMLKTLEKLIKTAYEIEQTLGQLLDRDTLRRLGLSLSEILVDHLEDVPGYEALIDTIMSKIILTLGNEKRRLEEQKALPLLT